MDLLEHHLTQSAQTPLACPVNFLTSLNDCETPEQAQAVLPTLFALVAAAPGNEDYQTAAAKMLELTRRRDHMLDTWAALSRRFPSNTLAQRMHMRWLRRENRVHEGRAILQAKMGQNARSHDAELLAELGENDACDLMLAELLGQSPDDAKTRTLWVKLLQARGEVNQALSVANPLRRLERLSASTVTLLVKLDAAAKALEILDPAVIGCMNLTSAALHQSILHFHDRQVPPSVSPHLGGISFITGTLGAGGAERQLTRIACAMHRHRTQDQAIEGIRLQGPVEIVITNVSHAAGNDFFLPQVQSAGIAFTALSDIEAEPIDEIGLPLGLVSDLAAALPKNALFGLQRLVAHFRRVRPEVAYIWQDGAVLMAALAALVAQVPRIVISVRGMPPSMRRNLAKDEFLGMYQALARVPGVVFSSNSRAAADAYCDWLALPKSAFNVIYNAFEAEPESVDLGETARWNAFAAETADARVTIGGVFRFDPNKRPLLWVEFAAAALQKRSDLRFVVVGSGAVLEQSRALAESLGIAERILFVGHSHNVGYWLGKMDILTLLSEFEGLPNVLIEAQLARLPVISTPAGGATETFVTGRTGLVLNSAKNPSLEDYLTKLEQLIFSPARLKFMGHIARERAKQKFAMPAILAQTVQLFKGHGPTTPEQITEIAIPSTKIAGARP